MNENDSSIYYDISNENENLEEKITFAYPIIFIAGVFGNLLSFIVFSRPTFQNSSFSIYFRFLNIIDLISLLLMINKFIDLKYNIRIVTMSKHLCKLIPYLAYSIPSISSYILVIISLDRTISIYSLSKQLLLRKKKLLQMIICILIIAYNFIFYISMTSWFNLVIAYGSEIDLNYENNSLIYIDCLLLDNAYQTFFWMDLVNSLLIPFLLMSTITFISLNLLFKSRKRVNTIASIEKSIRSKDLKFATTSVLLNLIFLTLNTPLFIYTFLYEFLRGKDGTNQISESTNLLISSILLLLYYCNFVFSFYTNLIFNQIFRNEFYSLFRKKPLHLTILINQIKKNKT